MESPETQILNGDQDRFQQNVIVMRHGDRLDNVERLWLATAARPWNPPLANSGRERAFGVGKYLRSNLGFPIHRVFVSPFLRCVQTAAEVVSALCAVEVKASQMISDNVAIDSSKIKVSVEYGLCEIIGRDAIRLDVAPKDGKWGFNISELQALLPAGTVDHSVQSVYKELPKWEESAMDAGARYKKVIQALADKFPSENLLLVTHGEGVMVALSEFLKDPTESKDPKCARPDYCAYLRLQRLISFSPSREYTAGNFELLTESGISYCPRRAGQ
ncbi:hypothetical protein HHK36_028025 [Tetracentron sinense]|uniref:Uncharacterized protein n=1 Tax=Tetracentron sinense TaxID=13715 RepID=A0A834YF22_TETSI|nr:hypothetical protein HHK36_028025 [Tetracentron sinense]